MIVLNYHGISDSPERDDWSLGADQFDAHMAVCRRHLISPDEFLAHCNDPARARSGGVLLTFDDANESDYTHVFARHTCADGTRFISFLCTDHVGLPGYLSWRMVEEMARHGIEFGSHGLAHRDLTTLSAAALRRELVDSKAMLEDRLSRSIPLFAFPFGRFTRPVWEAALEAGYTHLFTIQLGYHNGFEPFLYSRLCVRNSMGPDGMAAYLEDPCRDRSLAFQMATRLGVYRTLMRWRYR